MATKVRFQDTLKSTSFLDSSRPPLERLGALYFQQSQANQPAVQAQMREILSQPPSLDKHEHLLNLHTAVILAQNGHFEGVRYLMSLLQSEVPPDYRSLAETAIRNCSQFPISSLVAQAYDLTTITTEQSDLINLLHLTDDWFAKGADRQNSESILGELVQKLQVLRGMEPRSERKLALGKVISCPIRSEERYRYSGFVAVEREASAPLIVPFDLGDVLNRNDPRATIDIQMLLRRPGRYVVVVYSTTAPYEAQQLYILPSHPLDNDALGTLMGQLAQSAEGLTVGVTVEVIPDKGYRVITAAGDYHWETFRREYKQLGGTVLYHDSNASSINSQLIAPPWSVDDVTRRFHMNTTMPRAVWVKSFKPKESNELKHTFVCDDGREFFLNGDLNPRTMYYVVTITPLEKPPFDVPISLPGYIWNPNQHAQVFAKFLQHHPECEGVVLRNYKHDERLFATVIVPKTGIVLGTSIQKPVANGTVAYCETGSNEKIYASVVPQFRVEGGCRDCFGTSYRLCVTCGGDAFVICPKCKGSRGVTCPDCNGTLKSVCKHCGGNGRIRLKCTICDGRGHCKGCSGTKLYPVGPCNGCNGTGNYGTCYKCGGDGKFKKPCNRCNATGRCNKCGGDGFFEGECRTCSGTGLWDCGSCYRTGTIECTCRQGTVACPSCERKRVTRCPCGGRLKGIIVAE